ncbi:MAG: inorganic diphosphatase, partial [Rhodothermia bacterium]|nr:inorganic diphosphatase [Rhodothermia bacterium]
IDRAEVIVSARVVGGIQMIDGGEADDKIVAVLENDMMWSKAKDISDLPSILVERIHHYFSTYKQVPGASTKVSIEQTYGRAHALRVVEASLEDYEEGFGG